MSHGGDLVTNLSDSVTSWTVPHQAPLSMGFSRQEYWSGLAFPSPGDLLDPGIKPRSPALQADSLLSKPPGKPQAQRGHEKCIALVKLTQCQYWSRKLSPY